MCSMMTPAKERMGRSLMPVRLRDKSVSASIDFSSRTVTDTAMCEFISGGRGGQKIGLRETPGTDAFDEKYRRAFRGEPKLPSADRHAPAMPGTMRWLRQQY